MTEREFQPVINYMSPQQRPPRSRHWIGWVLFIGLAIMLFMLLNARNNSRPRISFSDFVIRLKAGQMASVQIRGNEIVGAFNTSQILSPGINSTGFRVGLPEGMASNWQFMEWLLANRAGADIDADSADSLLITLLMPIVPWILIFGFIWFVVFRQMRSQRNPRASVPTPVFIVNPPDGSKPS